MILKRYEKGMRFLDLERYQQRSMDEDGHITTDECWECVIYENGRNANEHHVIEFASEALARMFISMNEWKEQVL